MDDFSVLTGLLESLDSAQEEELKSLHGHVQGVSWQSEQSNLALLRKQLLILADILGPVGS